MELINRVSLHSPLISIVIPLFNKESQIYETINSVLAQTYKNYEIVIVNDGSTDNSCAIVKSIDDSRIRLINQSNSGVATARNRGITEAKGKYIALLDSDDLWKPTFLETIVKMTEKFPQCQVFAVNYEHKSQDNIIIPTIINKIPFAGKYGELSNYFEVASCSNPPICSISIMAEKRAFEAIGGFPIGVKSGEDLLTWARLACKFRIAYCKESLAIYQIPFDASKNNAVGRPHDKIDIVGQELEKLYNSNPNFIGLKDYVSFWYKMRASVSVRSNNSLTAIKECTKSLKFNIFNTKAWGILILSIMPKTLRNKLIK